MGKENPSSTAYKLVASFDVFASFEWTDVYDLYQSIHTYIDVEIQAKLYAVCLVIPEGTRKGRILQI